MENNNEINKSYISKYSYDPSKELDYYQDVKVKIDEMLSRLRMILNKDFVMVWRVRDPRMIRFSLYADLDKDSISRLLTNYPEAKVTRSTFGKITEISGREGGKFSCDNRFFTIYNVSDKGSS